MPQPKLDFDLPYGIVVYYLVVSNDVPGLPIVGGGRMEVHLSKPFQPPFTFSFLRKLDQALKRRVEEDTDLSDFTVVITQILPFLNAQ